MIDVTDQNKVDLLNTMEGLEDRDLIKEEEQAILVTAHKLLTKTTRINENYSNKVSHRKILTYTIVHENGEVCPRTYNQPCVHDDDEDNENMEGNFLSI